jgi:hypothetical protein
MAYPNPANSLPRVLMRGPMFRISWLAIVLCLLVNALWVPALAQEKQLDRPLVASGTSPMLEGDSADARKLALEEALRAAVEQSLGWLLPAQRIVRYYPLLLNRILKEPMSYIQDYQIIHEGVIFGHYRVTVQTSLYTKGLSRDLRRAGLFLASSERPRVAILVAERLNDDEQWRWWWQLESDSQRPNLFSQILADLLSAQGLVPLDPKLILENLPADQNFQEPLLGDAEGAALAGALAADVAVLGQVNYRPSGTEGAGMASGSLRAVKVDSGNMLARVSATVQVQPSGEQAASDYGFTALAERLTPHLVDGVLAPYVSVSQAPKEVSVLVEGVRSYGDLLLIKQYLQTAPEVKEIRQIKLKGDLGSFSLVLAGNLSDLENSLEGHDFGNFLTSAELSAENLITLTILSKR